MLYVATTTILHRHCSRCQRTLSVSIMRNSFPPMTNCWLSRSHCYSHLTSSSAASLQLIIVSENHKQSLIWQKYFHVLLIRGKKVPLVRGKIFWCPINEGWKYFDVLFMRGKKYFHSVKWWKWDIFGLFFNTVYELWEWPCDLFILLLFYWKTKEEVAGWPLYFFSL